MRLSFLGFVAILVLFLTQDVLFACAQAGEQICPECGGKGWHKCAYCDLDGEVQCPYCSGTGMTYLFGGGICTYCGGKGLIPCPFCHYHKVVICSLCGGKGVIGTEPQQTDGKSSWGIAALALTTVAVGGVAGLALIGKKREKKRSV